MRHNNKDTFIYSERVIKPGQSLKCFYFSYWQGSGSTSKFYRKLMFDLVWLWD